ncbi:prolipoprotein diacylglyceryl transferase family protein [Massilia sp. TWR1-2-2]|uniref:TlpA family protein disulfide reductase n=1 Tax=Massilia sp. TWR1-2-2 TaxID=2804584 RepID=UPI003CE89897
MDAINIGPMSFSVEMLATFAAILLATAAANRVARGSGVRVESALWVVIACALIAARAAYVLRYRDAYLSSPWSIFNVRDGGWIAWVGIVAGVATMAWLSWRLPPKRRALMAGVAAGMVVWMGAALAVAMQPKDTMQIPVIELANLRGGQTRLESFRGKPVVVNLWASWCPPCRREMPVLRAAQLRHPGVTFVFANQGESAAAVRAYLAAEQIHLDNVLLDQRLGLPAAIGSQGLPATLFFDAQGRLAERRLGELSAASLAQRLAAITDARQTQSRGQERPVTLSSKEEGR